MHDSLDRLRRILDEAVALPESAPAEALFASVDAIAAGVLAATEDIARAVAEGEPAPIAELQELKDTFEARSRELRFPLRKLLYRMQHSVKAALERVTFVEVSRGTSAPCGCAAWRAVAKGRGLSVAPSFPASRVVEEVDDAYESYRIHECGRCGSRWLQDFNPDSDPSVTQWWAR